MCPDEGMDRIPDFETHAKYGEKSTGSENFLLWKMRQFESRLEILANQ